MTLKVFLALAFVIAAPLLFLAAPVSAQQTIEDLIPACEAAADESYIVRRPAGYCVGFISGVWFMMNVNCINADYRHAIPQGLQAGNVSSWRAMVQAFLNWAEDHPEEWGEPVLVGVYTSLSSTFPCDE